MVWLRNELLEKCRIAEMIASLIPKIECKYDQLEVPTIKGVSNQRGQSNLKTSQLVPTA